MKIEDLKAGRVYRAKRPKVGFGSKYPVISVEKFLKWADKDITDSLPPNEWEKYKRCKNEK